MGSVLKGCLVTGSQPECTACAVMLPAQAAAVLQGNVTVTPKPRICPEWARKHITEASHIISV